MILTDKDILTRTNYLGRPLVKPFNEQNLTPNGYDLSMDEVKIGNIISNINIENITISSKTFFIIMSKEFIEMPDNMVATLYIRSSYARKGLILSDSMVDAGYHGKLALSMYNASNKEIVLEKDKKRTIVQIVFEQLESIPDKTYVQRSGNWQNQVTLK